MFEVAVYLMASVAITMSATLLAKRSFPRKRLVAVATMATVSLITISPYLWVEYLTLAHGDEIRKVVSGIADEESIPGSLKSVKVTRYSSSQAKALCTFDTGTNQFGLIIEFAKEGVKWAFIRDETVWSTAGSASGNSFPPYLHP